MGASASAPHSHSPPQITLEPRSFWERDRRSPADRQEVTRMYERFGGIVDAATSRVTFTLFVPDGESAPFQYEGGGLPRITDAFVAGSFQDPVNHAWDTAAPIAMARSDYIDPDDGLLKGWVYSCTSDPLPPGFYEYKYLVVFENKRRRWLTDPCARY